MDDAIRNLAAMEYLTRTDWLSKLKERQLSLMYQYSEDRWAAGWMSGLGIEVWLSSDPTCEEVRKVAEITGVWYPHDHFPVPLDEWKAGMHREGFE